MKRIGLLAVFLSAALLAMPGSAAAQVQYRITMTLDEATAGNVEILVAAAATAGDGAPVSQSLRGVVMSVVGEMHLALQDRFSVDTLRLDDGQTAAASDAVSVDVSDQTGNANLTFSCDASGHCKPESLSVCTPSPASGRESNGCLFLLIPPRTWRSTVE